MTEWMSKKRGGIRGLVTKDINRIVPMLRGDVDMEPVTLLSVKRKLEHNLTRLYALDEKILQALSGNEADTETETTENYNDKVINCMAQIEAMLAPPAPVQLPVLPNTSGPPPTSRTSAPHSATIKLPKFEMAAFKGDPMSWQPFWDVYKATIHDNSTMSAVEKFSYLLGYLAGDALSVASGYSLTEANYDQVIAALQERFGNNQRAKFAHFQALIAIEPARGKNLDELRRISDQCELHIRSLVALDVEEETFSLVFTSIVLSKLPEYLRTKMCEKTGKNDWTLAQLREWIKEDISAREMSESSFQSFGSPKMSTSQNFPRRNNFQNQRPNMTTAALPAPSGAQNRSQGYGNRTWCVFCSTKTHNSQQCKTHPTVEERVQLLKDNNACFICLRQGHPTYMCEQQNKVCGFCSKPKHHIAICRTRENQSQFHNGPSGTRNQWSNYNRSQKQWPNQNQWWNNQQRLNQWSNPQQRPPSETHNQSRPQQNISPRSPQESENKKVTPKNTMATVAVTQEANHGEIDVSFLQTAVATLQNDSDGNVTKGRLLMDSASSRTYIREKCCQELGLEIVGKTYISVGRFGTTKRTTKVADQVRLNVVCIDGSIQPVLATVTPVISCPVSRTPIDRTEHPIVNSLPLAEPLNEFPDSLDIDVLIGSDQYFNFILPKPPIVSESLVFVPSRLGFLTAGTMSIAQTGNERPENTLVLFRPDAEVVPAQESYNIEQFWQIEDIGGKEKKQADLTEEQALKQFQDTVQYRDGRYHVALPWKSKEPNLPNNFGLAYGRLRSTLARLRNDEVLMTEYVDIIQKQFTTGMIEEAPEKPDGMVYYIPHHPVIKPNKNTKVRIVYDASSKANKNASSLNDCLYRGPVILEDLCGLIMRFRLNKIAILSDIEKAFLQVRIQLHDRDVARFLWVVDPKKPPTGKNLITYRFTSVFFGSIASPFLLGAVIDTHLRRNKSQIAQKLLDHLYVDNIITGEDDVQSATYHYHEAKRLFLGASMNLREFYTNSTSLRECFAPEDRGKSPDPRVLGIGWDLESDCLQSCGLKRKNPEKPLTKRRMAQEVATIYDPLGWFAPVVVTGKLLLQKLWKEDLAWDEMVPSSVEQQWEITQKELSRISECSIPRYIHTKESITIQLHAFCDASQLAAGAVVYLRVENPSTTACDIQFAKTRLAPLKPIQTIPRLELIGLVMGVNMIEFVESQLRLQITKKVVWSDSQCVLYWLTKERLSTKFVERRIHEIREKKDIEFRYVPSASNPADLLSRGCTFEELRDNAVWWHGPPWLLESQVNWPKDRTARVPTVESNDVEEITQLATVETTRRSAIVDPQKFSSMHRLLRVTAFVLRFLHNVRVPAEARSSGTLSVHEIANARFYWEKLAQTQGFPKLEGRLTPKILKRSSVGQLNVFRDPRGLLRCAGRLSNSQLPYDSQNPVLLPKHHPITYLIIQAIHVKSGHAGVAQTLSALRQRYWVVQGRSRIKRVLRNCQRCRRIEGSPYHIPDAPPLPDFRVKVQIPFNVTGLDYLGYLHVKTGPHATQKVWVCLFTCAASRAIHLELVENQSADEFHLALRRFFAIQGSPKLIVSDNASQFLTVESAMKKLWQELTSSADVENLAASHNVEWKKIPQVAPWMGGFYERLVGVVKRVLKKTLDGLCVNLSELRTTLAEIAWIVNSRPLLYVEDDVSSVQLSPADLLGKAKRNILPTFNEQEQVQLGAQNTVEKIVSRWKRLQSVTSQFWDQWKQAYLTSLREKHANATQRNPSWMRPTINSVVQIKDKMPRAQWRLGKIEKLFPSADGNVRSVLLRLANGRTIVRPLKLLYPLEMQLEKPLEQSHSKQKIPAYTAACPFESDNEDFCGFSSQDIENVARNIEKYDQMEQMLLRTDRDQQKKRPQRDTALRARSKIRETAENDNLPSQSWWECSDDESE